MSDMDHVTGGARHYDPKIGGIHTFAVNKYGITRAVLNFKNGPPERKPLTLGFHYPSCYITHRYILDTIKNEVCAATSHTYTHWTPSSTR